MILFKSIKWKNLLSTGNAFTEISLNETPNVLIIGENGSGKSTLLDALTFSLFGRPFRKINKPNLLNSINKKNCVAEVEFSSNNKEYKVIRGIKPNVFEIWCDGVCLNQDSASKDYQEHLEKFILKMNYKSFTQIVVLGSASFVPFMQLSPADRRAVIEDLLDIQVFSVMNNIVKARYQENKDKLERNRIELYGKEEKKEVVEKNLTWLKKNEDEAVSILEERITGIESELDKNNASILSFQNEKTHWSTVLRTLTTDNNKKLHSQLLKLQGQLESKKKTIENLVEFYCGNDDCPTCKQSIGPEFKTSEIKTGNEKIVELKEALSQVTIKIEECLKTNKDIEITEHNLNQVYRDIEILTLENKSLNKQIKELKERIKTPSDNTLSKNELEKVQTEIDNLIVEKQELLEQRQYLDTALGLLKDGGIKTKIIRQYLPIINQKINKYLLQMGFYCNFNVDENFEETIKSQYRDDFSYQNFSEGEKFRIDLSILLAWRAVAKVKNSVNTNLLIFDEIFDSSLDVNGTDEFLKIMWSLVGDTNVFVISHKSDQLIEKFQKVYRFGKKKNFSVVIE